MKVLIKGLLFALLSMNPLLAMDGATSDFNKMTIAIGKSTGNDEVDSPGKRNTSIDSVGSASGKIVAGKLKREKSDHIKSPRMRRNSSNNSMTGSGSLLEGTSSSMHRIDSGLLPGHNSPALVKPLDERESRLSNLVFERATLDDCAAIMQIYKNFGPEDHKRLLVFPDPFQEIFLLKSLEKGRIFVARHRTTREIVAFLKMFVIVDEAERSTILVDELRALSFSDDGSELIANVPMQVGRCEISKNFNFEKKLEYAGLQRCFPYNNSATIVYYGGAYTADEYRGCGVNLQMERYAFKANAPAIYKEVTMRGSSELIYCHGVVAANAGSGSGRFPSFAEAIRLLRCELGKSEEEPIPFATYLFATCKPAFEVIDHNYRPRLFGEGEDVEEDLDLSLLDDAEDRLGEGVLICYKIQ